MDASEIERALEELETRSERLRALYEQYFMGIEKLEPQIQRKDVDRRIVLLRKEQIRNTGMRFKFQMLVQRYNTMQQYWQRITREIENGTYRRDVLRAASRVGAKEALTIVGKKRAAQYERLVAQQDQQRDRRAQREEDELIEAELIEDEGLLEEIQELEEEDEAPTPPSRRVEEPKRDSRVEWPRQMTPAPMSPHVPSSRPASSQAPSARASQPQIPPASPSQSGGTGLRLGGRAPAPATDPEAAKRRVAALAAQMRAEKQEPREGPSFGALDLDLGEEAKSSRRGAEPKPTPSRPEEPARAAPTKSGRGGFGTLELGDGIEAPVQAPPPPVAEKPRPAAAPTAQRIGAFPPRPGGFASRPLPPPEVASSPLPRAAQPSSTDAAPPRAAEAKPAPEPKRAAEAKPAPEPKPAPVKPPAASPAASSTTDSGIDDKRMRQIYAKYVETKRSANESTAGVTFEKLTASLRAQADKLRAQHKKSVDYEVVVKDGKTVLKPILR